MRKELGVLIFGIIFLLAGCQKQEIAELPKESVAVSSQEKVESENEVLSSNKTYLTEEQQDGSESVTVSPQEKVENEKEALSLNKTYSIEEQQDGSVICTYGEIKFTIPAEWKDKYTVIVEGDNLFIYHIDSWMQTTESKYGLLCGIKRSDNVVEEWDRMWPLAYTDEYVYYYEAYPISEYERETEEELSMLKEHEPKVKNSIVISAEGVHYDADEYYLPMSAIKEVPDRVLRFMPKRSLQIARNEIYARHGRKFKDSEMQEHFAACSWYTPSVEADDFDESVLSEIEKTNIAKIKEQEALLAERNAYLAGEPSKPGTYSIEEQQDGSAICRFEEITFTIPAEWKGKYVVEAHEDGLTFSQKASVEVDDTSGYLCSIVRKDDIIDWPETVAIAYTNEYIYYFARPSDVPYCQSGIPFEKMIKIAEGYWEMANLTGEMKESVVIDAQGLRYDMYEFYFPMSAVKEISDWDIEVMSDKARLIARSEIYARHGCIFNDTAVQEHFMSCSWYTPLVEEDKFDEGVLSPMEKLNIQKIKAAEEAIHVEQ